MDMVLKALIYSDRTYIYFNKNITINKIKAILDIGKTMLNKKVQLITDVEKVLIQLKKIINFF